MNLNESWKKNNKNLRVQNYSSSVLTTYVYVDPIIIILYNEVDFFLVSNRLLLKTSPKLYQDSYIRSGG